MSPSWPSTGKMRPDANRTATRSGIFCSQMHPAQLTLLAVANSREERYGPSEPEALRRPPSQPRNGKRRASAGARLTDSRARLGLTEGPEADAILGHRPPDAL